MSEQTQSPQPKSFVNILLVVALVIASGAIGHLWTKNQYLQQGGNTLGNNAVLPAAGGAPQALAAGEVDPITDDDLVRGNRDAEIALIEWSDLECPFCSQFHPTAKKIVEEYDGKVMWVYRHFPLTSIHPKAQKFAEATECVNKLEGQEKAWEMIDTLFADQATTVEQLPSVASKLGVNQSAFTTCLDNDEMADRITAQTSSGSKAGVTGTPGNIILNIKTGETSLLPGAVPFEQVKAAIDGLL